mgnify:CR=1 FL=1
MKKYLVVILIIIPLLGISQSGISLSGSSTFQMGQHVFDFNSPEIEPINIETRNNKITLSYLRGRKLKIGTFLIKSSISYNIDKTTYNDSNTPNSESLELYDLRTTTANIIPSFELWCVILQNENTFVYTSFGGYGILSNLTINSGNITNTYEYNRLIPFFRIGTQLNYGKLFINPFISFDLKGMEFESLNEIFSNTNIETQFQNYKIRTGLEFGIMF